MSLLAALLPTQIPLGFWKCAVKPAPSDLPGVSATPAGVVTPSVDPVGVDISRIVSLPVSATQTLSKESTATPWGELKRATLVAAPSAKPLARIRPEPA